MESQESEALENQTGAVIEGVIGVQQECMLDAVPLISSILFAASKPVSLPVLIKVSELDREVVLDCLEEIKGLFNSDVHGFFLESVAGGYQFRTAPGAASAIRRLIPPRVKRLSRAAAETLAVIAYKQPVQRAEIEGIRGVDALPTLRTLLDANMIRIVGHQDSAGQPALYGTTNHFLERFGLKDLGDLPSLRELEQLATDPGEEDGEGDGTDVIDAGDEIPGADEENLSDADEEEGEIS